MSAYRASHRLAIIWIVLTLFVVATTLGGIFYIIARHPDGPNWLLILPVAYLLLFVAVGVQMMGTAEERRRQRIGEALEAKGFTAQTPPAPDGARAMFESVGFLEPHLDLRNRDEGMKWIAIRLPGHFFFEHEWALGSGRGRTVLTRTVLVFQAEASGLRGSALGDGPWFATHRPRLIGEGRRIRRLSGPIRTGYRDFDRRWLSIGSASTASAFLTDEVRRLLGRSPRGESWVIGHGFVCCSFNGSFEAPMLERMWDHARAVLASTG